MSFFSPKINVAIADNTLVQKYFSILPPTPRPLVAAVAGLAGQLPHTRYTYFHAMFKSSNKAEEIEGKNTSKKISAINARQLFF